MKKFLMMALMAGAMFVNAPKAMALPCCQPDQDPTTCTPCGELGCSRVNEVCLWTSCCNGLTCVNIPSDWPMAVCERLL